MTLRRVSRFSLLALTAACSDPRPTGAVRERLLLARRPDTLLEVRGELRVDPEDGWGAFDRGGWAEGRAEFEDGTHYRRNRQRSAGLELAAAEPRDRTIELDACVVWRPGAEGDALPPAVALVELNGVELGPVGLTPALRTVSVEAPAAAWLPGRNLFEIELEPGFRRQTGGQVRVAVSRIGYGRESRVGVDLERRRLTLANGSGARYRLGADIEGILHLAGTSESEGALEVRFTPIDVATGAPSRETGAPVRLERTDGELAAALELPDWSAPITELELVWRGADERSADLVVSRLSLETRVAVDRPPIVFVSIDTLAARNVGFLDYLRETTPRLTELTSESIVFEHCRANAPRTLDSYLSQFSGLYPTANVVENEERPDQWLPPIERHQLAPNRWTIAELLRSVGYGTAAWVDNPWLARGIGISQGFDLYDVSPSEIPHWGPGSEDMLGGIAYILPRALRWIESRPEGEPFFALIQALDVHGPYVPLEPWKGSFGDDAMYDPEHTLPVAMKQHSAFGSIPRYVAAVAAADGPLPERLPTAPFANAYDDKILELDARLGSFFDDLRASGILDRSVLIVSADHGESLLDHDYYFGHGTLYGETLHVPLLVRLPGGRNGGTRIRTPIQLVDLYPTIAELAGVPIDRFEHLSGRSLVDALESGDQPEPVAILSEGGVLEGYALELDGWKLHRKFPDRAAYQTMVSHPEVRDWLRERLPAIDDRSLTNNDLKQLLAQHPEVDAELKRRLRGPVHELFDLRTDPGETRDLLDAEPERAKLMIDRLDAELERARTIQALADRGTDTATLSAESREQLRRLGYLEEENAE